MLSLPQTVGQAILALSCLDTQEDGDWRLARDIAETTGISPSYLSKILHTLGQEGLVEAKRGYRGGFVLARDPAAISLYDVTRAIDPSYVEHRCLLGLQECSDERACPAHRYWKRERERVEQLLRAMTIADVADFERDLTAGGAAAGAASNGSDP